MEEVNKEIFKIENLNLYYGEKHALIDINLPIYKKNNRFYWTFWMWKIDITKML